ncbi:MFS transporter, FHS family, L-fucose permease [Microbulbifer donghaiensis]|uniref:MFS transporter, FHS family, L-fucose permease n=1 Tax=Microbulbifer donghaiensis TaxID=494016 RepID=A0A1M5B5C5_9GAMM|nr:sugar MFS transporter [Microbulbifer donghaiensis]SHF37713.1 MFS transporter, FHS family, L-fucose permease [Microbulbifer donghaiensis]
MATLGSNIEAGVVGSEGYKASSHQFALVALTSLFFMWGFITCLNDILIPHLKGVFDLNYAQAMLVQFCFFGAYFLISLPAGWLVSKLGYQRGIVVGLSVAVVGCLLFIPAERLQVYGLFLFALFVLASGITVLQVSANPYVTALGSERTAASRLTMTQAFNSLGTTIAPFFGAFLILSVAGVAGEHITAAERASAVELPYLILAAALAALAVTFALLKLPRIESHAEAGVGDLAAFGKALAHRHLFLGALAIFLYVGAEVSIGSFLVNFLSEDSIAGITEQQAAFYVSLYWGGAMVGRFIGAVVMRYLPAGKVLASCSLGACVLLAITIAGSGSVAMWAVLAIGLCNSVMFPTIFSLALARLGGLTSQGSGILCLAIVGGALVPVLQGVLADQIGIQLAFVLPVLCYLYILFYGVRGHRVRES